MNLFYKNIYLKDINNEELKYFNSLLTYFHFNPSEYFISRHSFSHVQISSILDKNLKFEIYFSEDVVLFKSKRTVFGDSENQLFFQKEKHYELLNNINPFFDDKNVIARSKTSRFSNNLLNTDKYIDFVKNFKPEEHRYNRTKEEILCDSTAEFSIEKTIPLNGDKLIQNFILNYTIKNSFGFTPSNKVMGFISDHFPELLVLGRDPINRRLEVILNYDAFKDLLIFDKNKELTKESKELFFLNFEI